MACWDRICSELVVGLLKESNAMLLRNFCRFKNGGPEVMINLELWQPPGFNMDVWLNHVSAVTGGPLGSLGRYVKS
jgi:hypothetical protein